MLDTTQDLIDAGCASGDKLSADLALALNDALCDVNARDAEIDRLTRELATLRAERTSVAFTSANSTLDRLASDLGHDADGFDDLDRGPYVGTDSVFDRAGWEQMLSELDELIDGDGIYHCGVEPDSNETLGLSFGAGL